MITGDLELLKQRIPLLHYLQQRHWTARRVGAHPEFVGRCPLHPETRPSFYVNARKNLFYCHGCGRGGDLIRLVELSLGLSFRQSVAYLQQQIPSPSDSDVLERVVSFCQLQLHRHPQAVHYLQQRGLCDPAIIEELGIGYAPGGSLRHHLVTQGDAFQQLLSIGLINSQGRDTFCRRVIFPLRQQGLIANLYGRSIGSAFPHCFLPRHSKGGLFAWDSIRCCSSVILVEGLFDLAVLWQAGFRNTTSALGCHPTPSQFDQLCNSPSRLIYICFDRDESLAGQHAAQELAARLESRGIAAPIVHLPAGHDPNSYFLSGATAADFATCLQTAQRL
jgi:DNA primase